MSRPAHFASDAFAISRFPLHGQTAVEVRGPVMRSVVRGPFNLELVQAQCRLLSAAAMSLPGDRRFLELIEYQQSLLMPAEAWDCMARFITDGVRAGYCALCTLVVLGEDVEGEALFREAVLRLWSSSRPVRLCRRRDEAEALLVALQIEHGLDPSAATPAPA